MKYRREVSINHLIHKLKHDYAIHSWFKRFFPSQFHNLVAGILGVGVGVAGLYVSLWDGNLVSTLFVSEQNNSFEIVHTVAGLQNLGNNCFLNVILQALASCSCFLPFLQNILVSNDLVIEEKAEKMPLTVALSSLLKGCYQYRRAALCDSLLTCFLKLCIVRDEKAVVSPRRVMLAMGLYVSSFNLTRQQDAAEAFLHLLSSLEEEISQTYVLHDSSLADITAFPSKIYKRKREGQNECERWKQQFLGPFDGTIGSSLTCRSCSSILSMDFEFFRCLPLSPVLDRRAEIMDGCTVVDCFKHFTAVEHVENYRCSRCWHIAALKYLANKTEKDEAKIKMLGHCIKLDSCECKSLFLQEELTWTGFTCALKQLSIARCPRILCIHLQRASMNEYGELIKLQGQISFPLFLDLFPFTQVSTNVGQGTLEENVQKHEKHQQHPLVPQPRHFMQCEMHMLQLIYRTFGEDLCLETLGKSTYEPSGHPSNETIGGDYNRDKVVGSEMVASDLHGSQAGSINETGSDDKVEVGSIGSSNSSKSCMYRLSSVVEHYGRPGSGHYAVYRRLGSELGAGVSVGPSEPVNQQWVYVSDREVSVVSEETVLAAEVSLLFYERIEACL